MAKYAPKRKDGLSAYVITHSCWGKETNRIEWAENLRAAKSEFGWTRELYTSVYVRRATTADLEATR